MKKNMIHISDFCNWRVVGIPSASLNFFDLLAWEKCTLTVPVETKPKVNKDDDTYGLIVTDLGSTSFYYDKYKNAKSSIGMHYTENLLNLANAIETKGDVLKQIVKSKAYLVYENEEGVECTISFFFLISQAKDFMIEKSKSDGVYYLKLISKGSKQFTIKLRLSNFKIHEPMPLREAMTNLQEDVMAL